jgi:hypothetical protein
MKFSIFATVLVIITLVVFATWMSTYAIAPPVFYRFGVSYDPSIQTLMPTVTIERALLEMNGRAGSYENANVLFLNNYDDLDLYNRMIPTAKKQSPKFIYSLRSINMFASKNHLYIIMKKALTPLELRSVLPDTLPVNVLTSLGGGVKGVIRKSGGSSPGPMICKTNQQRQQGIIVSNSVSEVESAISSSGKMSVCQRVLNDPYTVNGLKINIRVYMMVVKRPGEKFEMSVWKDGFVYYAPLKYEKGTTDKRRIVTTGYIDRDIYQNNPMTLGDLQKLIRDEFKVMWTNVLEAMKLIKFAYSPIVNEIDGGADHTRFMIFGCDFAPCENLKVKIMEINKGPDMNWKDDRDGKVKREMVNGFFRRAFYKDRMPALMNII